uniref:Uncharacterized protein n=1 Tax=Glossina palpalis gambiensis TaxID=67801 RepID=A0A1B0C7I3_9MUSC
MPTIKTENEVNMLQNDAIRNLYQDTGADTSQQTPKESNVLDVPVNVTFQPGAQRLPLPITRMESNIGITTYYISNKHLNSMILSPPFAQKTALLYVHLLVRPCMPLLKALRKQTF